MTFRGSKVPFPSTIQILVLAVLISAAPVHAKKKPTPTPSSLPPTSPMLAVPGAEGGNEEPDKLINSDMSGRDLEFLTTVVNCGRAQTYFIDLLHTSASSDEIKEAGGESEHRPRGGEQAHRESRREERVEGLDGSHSGIEKGRRGLGEIAGFEF